MAICETVFFLLHKKCEVAVNFTFLKCEVAVNFTFFCEAKMVKLRVFVM
jgi:hypothetical protein